MGEAFPTVALDVKAKDINKYITKNTPAVVTKDQTGIMHIITQYDIIQSL